MIRVENHIDGLCLNWTSLAKRKEPFLGNQAPRSIVSNVLWVALLKIRQMMTAPHPLASYLLIK